MLRSARMAAMTGRAAALSIMVERPVGAVHVGRSEIVWQDRHDTPKVGKDPRATFFWLQIQPPSAAHFSRFGRFARL